MARSRNIKPGFSKNEFLAQKSVTARLLFAMLPTIADREGRLEDRPLRIKGELFPYENHNVDALLNELAAVDDAYQDHPFIIRYEVDGRKYIQITKFRDNQNPHTEERESCIPEYVAGTTQAPCSDDAQHDGDTVPASECGLKVKGISKRESENRESARQLSFDNWWNVVHLKKGKAAAEKAYTKAVARLRKSHPDRDPHAYLRERMCLFAASPEATPEHRAPIHPATWLNNGRYDDDESTWQSRGSPGGYESRTERTIRELSQMEDFFSGDQRDSDEGGGNDLRLLGPPS